MIKIKVCTQSPDGSCSYYRSLGVFQYLHKISEEPMVVETITNFEWHNLVGTDVVFFERPRDESMVKAIEFTKNFGIPVWIDIDDDFFTIPKYNPSYQFFNQKNTRASIELCLRNADIITVTTETLKKVYEGFNKNIFVVENAFNDYNYVLAESPSEKNIINWRGSITHRDDILSCLEPLVKLSEDNPEYSFSFIGSDLWYVERRIKNITIKQALPLVGYMNYTKALNPQIQISPLEFNEFNRSKSNINWLEGAYSGAVSVAPNMEEWRKPGIELYNNQQEFYDKIDMLIKDKKKRIKNFYQSLDYINENLLLGKVNQKRIDVVNFLLKK